MSATGATMVATPGKAVPPPRPSRPIMESVKETYMGSNSFYYPFGSKPRANWNGTKKSRLLANLCFQALDPVSGQKSSIYQMKGFKYLIQQ